MQAAVGCHSMRVWGQLRGVACGRPLQPMEQLYKIVRRSVLAPVISSMRAILAWISQAAVS